MTNTPAGWYSDPQDATRSRWWDGAQWTDQQSAPYVAAVAPTALKAPEGTSWNTVWIWLTVFLPYVPLLGFFAIDWSSFFDLSNPIRGELAILTSAGYLFAMLGGFVSYGLCVLFSYLDWRVLTERGVPRPFHWAWGFLSYVYPIGRSVVVRRRTGRGISPMWVTIILFVVANVALVAFFVMVMVSAIATFPELSYTYSP